MAGDGSLFAREDAVEAAWGVVGGVLDDATALHLYRPGTWGPEEADSLAAPHGGWHDPAASEARRGSGRRQPQGAVSTPPGSPARSTGLAGQLLSTTARARGKGQARSPGSHQP